MNRKYTTKEYEEVVDRLRAHIPDVAITTDVMVGFPGETEEEFSKTYEFLKKINLYQMHVFKFSPRKGTPAAKFDNQIAPEIKDIRSKLLINLSKEHTHSFNKKHEGHTLPIIAEQNFKDSKELMEGMTPNYIRVVVKADENLAGSIINVYLKEAVEDYIVGEI
jgi:threonylcarbamoyladenosine tRNA methylthiotransferase MtaB